MRKEEDMIKRRLAVLMTILMGTVFSDRINRFCLEHGLKYMPFVGKVWGRPSVLEGDIDEMIAEAKSYIGRGAYGIDLLGYRYTGDAVELNRRMSAEVDAPVCIAGSVNSFNRLDEIKEAGPWSFTIGSAFFDNKFSGTFAEQIDKVCDRFILAAVLICRVLLYGYLSHGLIYCIALRSFRLADIVVSGLDLMFFCIAVFICHQDCI